jgi:hypothetical protein
VFSSPALDPRDPVRAELEQDGRFRVIARIGAGGMGVVYRVHDRERGEDVALKTLKLPSAAAIYGIKREFRSLADVAHPNLVALRELLCIRDRWCITMELVEGTDFLSYVTHKAPGAADLLARTTRVVPTLLGSRADPRAATTDGLHALKDARDRDHARSMPADPARLGSALAQLSSAVAALHARKKLHLDLKPMNVLVQPDGRVVVLDFGLVREIEGKEPLAGTSVLGTPIYMAPEQAFSPTPSEAADWYAIGCMLYEALTGITPFIGPVQSLLVEKQLRDAPSARALAPDVPAAWSDLCQALLRRDPRTRGGMRDVHAVLSAGAQPEPARSGRTRGDARPSFVGRAELRARMTARFAETRHGAPRTLLLHGASGIGKTALARAWLDSQRAASEELLVLEGRCLEREAVPYKALDSVIDELSRFLQTLAPAHIARIRPTYVAALVRVFPVLSRVPAFAGYDVRRARGAEDQTERELAFLALKGLLARIAQEQRVVIFIDDLQWGDRDSALFVRELLSQLDAPGVFWLGTYRSEEEASSPFLQTLFARSHEDALGAAIEREPVPALERGEMKMLSERMLAQQGRASELADAIVAECQGNPFFAEELVRALEPDRASKKAPDRPPSLEEVLLRRVSALPASEQRLLDLVCVVGRPIERSLVLELGEAGQAALDALRAHRLLRAHGARELDLIEPYHDRIREIVGSRVALDERARIHLAVAQRLEAKERGDAELLLLHYAEAGDHVRAASNAVRAARVAQEALAFDHAIALLRRALTLGAGQGRTRDEIALHVALGLSLSCAGYSAEAAQAYLTAAARFSSRAEPRASTKSTGQEALTLRRKAAEQHLVGGRYQEGIALLHETLPALGVKLRKSSQSALSSIAYQRTRLALRGLGFHERAEADVDPSLLTRIDTSYAVANGLGMLDSLVAADVQTRGVLWSLAAGEPFRVLRALTYEAAFRCGNLGGQLETEKIIARAEALSDRLDTQVARGLVAFCKAFYAHHGTGDLRAVKEPYAAGEELLLGSPGMNGEVVMLRCNFFTALDWLGDLPSLRTRIPMHLADAERRGDLLLKTGIVSAALYWLGQDACADLGAHIEACRRDWPRDLFVMPHYWLLVAELQRDVYLGDGRAALARAESAWRALKRSFYLSIPTVRIEILYPRARAALLCARQGHATRDMLVMAQRDLASLSGTRRAYALALAASLQPSLHVLAGDAAAYVIWSLERAMQLCDEAGLIMQREAARYCLGVTLGGEAGGYERRRALSRLAALGVKNPRALIAALMPAFSE